MNKIITIIKREYKETVFKKGFIILTLLIPVFMIGVTIIPALLIELESDTPLTVNVVDESGLVAAPLQSSLTDTLKNGQPKFILNIIRSGTETGQLVDAQKSLIEKELIDGLLYIPASVLDSNRIEFYARNVSDFQTNRTLNRAVEKIIIDYRLKNSGFDPQIVQGLITDITLRTVKIQKGGKERDSDFTSEYFSTFIFVLILYMTLIVYGTSIMRSIIQEKSNKVVEVILASVKPIQLMAGKILGQGLVGLTQYAIWSIVAIGISLGGSSFIPMKGNGLMNISTVTMIWFVVYYVLGYFLYSGMYSIIGVATTSDQEAQQASMPITLLLVVPLLVLTTLVKNPDSSLITGLSYIPFFSPIIMFARINMSAPAAMEIILSLVILIVSIIGVIWLAAKVYRMGILMTGKRANLPEIMRWIRAK